MGDFNASQSSWGSKKNNDLGVMMYEILQRHNNLHICNSQQYTRKDQIIDLTIASDQLANKVINWQVKEEVFLNTDHKLIQFECGQSEIVEKVIKWDFNKTNWSEFEKECDARFKEWKGDQRNVQELY